MENRQRIFVDMDGTLAVFQPVDTFETLLERGYFLRLPPIENVVGAVKNIMERHPEIEVFVLTSVLTDSKYALSEKQLWLDRYLPEIDRAHRFFAPAGTKKIETLDAAGGLKPGDFLLDDYTVNLNDWQPPARGLKILNGLNHTRGTWKHDRIDAARPPGDLAERIAGVVSGRERCFDGPAQGREKDRTRGCKQPEK
jgi:5'(3')-deoxyribonucleotidase